ncbi:hypothetical protein OC842_000183 [Tilletia horrida]|uniref:Uncharacterized protein n=1 Tax=Tilletia horrida TaxID=155126 RepID=A0AAN6GHH3_9BASI|nr:hypothetical protein OC842_000183 [Tilletia horrida]
MNKTSRSPHVRGGHTMPPPFSDCSKQSNHRLHHHGDKSRVASAAPSSSLLNHYHSAVAVAERHTLLFRRYHLSSPISNTTVAQDLLLSL